MLGEILLTFTAILKAGTKLARGFVIQLIKESIKNEYARNSYLASPPR